MVQSNYVSGNNIAVGYQLDNIVIWDHVVSENPSWLYNGGAGRENALHYMYGAPDYRPKLTGPNNGVGYYYLP